MKPFIFALLLLSNTALACNPNDVVTYGATTGATMNGRPLISVEGVGISIERRGGSGSFAIARDCDPATAAAIRKNLTSLLEEESFIVPAWLER